MHRSVPWRFAALCLALSTPASAQVVWDMPKIIVPKPKFDDAPVPSRASAWPRLDPGAVFCRTAGDLQRLAAARRGQSGERPNCQVIQMPTAVVIVRRAGPGQTEVTLTDQNAADGWTDAYLPDRPPAYNGQSVRIR